MRCEQHRIGVSLRRMTCVLLAFAFIVASTAPRFARAQDAAKAVAAVAPAPPVDDTVILPFLDEGTFFVARLDVDRVDREKLGEYMHKSFEMIMGQMPPQIRGQIQAQMAQQVETMKSWLKDMSDAGGKHVYILLDTADLGGGDGEGPSFVIPLGKEANSDQIKGLLSRFTDGGMQVSEVGGAMVMGEPGVITRVTKRFAADSVKVEPHADLAKALSSAGDAPLRIALVPGESARKWVEDNLPQLPEELGGGETTILSRGVRYATLTVKQVPNTTASLSVKCENPDKAKALLDTLNKGLATAKTHAANSPQAEDLNKKIDSVKPKLAGDTLSLSIDPMDLQFVGMGVAGGQVGPGAPAPPPTPAKADDGGL